ncbi:MAG: toprim domain-containing protein [Verrucomicrobia bacterium]|nr:MAG: toprim domain-containing protein [Verrucomicrobiota bacterium]
MSLDLSRLVNLRRHGGKLTAQCPACEELGDDSTDKNHLFVPDDGEGRFGCINFQGPSGSDHRKRIRVLVGVTTSTVPKTISRPLARARASTKTSPSIPALRPLGIEEMAQIAYLRGWQYFAGLQLLADRNLLYHADMFDDGKTWPSWVITDSARRNAQARRLDGELWRGIGGAKAKTLPGCDPSWPIGCAEIGNLPLVLLCEGQPDFAAALLVAWWESVNVAPVCMTGAGNSIHQDALANFAGKHVRIAIHDDDAGRKAAKRWSDQLYLAGAARVDGIDFSGLEKWDGQPVEDLSDFATLLDPEAPATVQVLSNLGSLLSPWGPVRKFA